MDFLTTLTTVVFMLLYAVPGFVLMKTRAIGESAIPAISKILLFVCQPAFAIYAFSQLDFSWRFLIDVLLFMMLIIVLQLIVIFVFLKAYKKKWGEVRYRICTIASCFGNCVFFGAPVLDALMPHFPEAIVFANAYAVSMNLLGWTVGSAIITKNKRYISLKKVFLNPGSIGFIVAVLIYISGINLHPNLSSSLFLLGKMTTPLSMMVLGMRLATVRIKPIFTTPIFYFTVFVKQMIFPIISLIVTRFLPWMSDDLITTTFILCACPVASVVLNFSEMLGDGQEDAADTFLLGTTLSAVTMPIILLLL